LNTGIYRRTRPIHLADVEVPPQETHVKIGLVIVNDQAGGDYKHVGLMSLGDGRSLMIVCEKEMSSVFPNPLRLYRS
jgi:hypothetical protein